MKQGRRFGFSAEQQLDVWRRWKAGQSLHEIGRAFGKEHSLHSLSGVASRGDCSGRPAACAPPALTLREREKSPAGWLPVRRSGKLPNV